MNRILYILGLVLILGLSIFFMSKEDDISEFNNDKIIKHITINDYTKIEDMKSDRKSTSIQIEYIDEQKPIDVNLNLQNTKDKKPLQMKKNLNQQYSVDDMIIGNDDVQEYIKNNNLKNIPKRVSSNTINKEKEIDDKIAIFKIEVLSNSEVVYVQGVPPKVPKYLYGIFNSVQEPFKIQIPLELKSDIVSLKVTNTKTNDIIIQNVDIQDLVSGDFKQIDITEP